MGQVVAAPYNPFTCLFIQDPLFRFALFPLSTEITVEEKKKLNRVYYPRTRELLVNSYEAIIFYDARIDHFTARQFGDLEYAFREAGMSSVAAHSISFSVWQPTVLYDLSPISVYDFRYTGIWRVRFRREREPVFLPFADLGMEQAFGGEYARITPKEGTTVWADMVPEGVPWLVSWRPGGPRAGMQWAFGDKFDPLWWGTTPGYRSNNPYALDLATNLLLHSTGRPLVADIHGRREARLLLSTFQTRKLLILSMAEWAERFGANALPITEQLIALEREADEALDYYLEQDYGATMSFMQALDPRVSQISDLARKLKDHALFGVYISEWLAVTSVSMVAGSVLWGLMVRKRMYREAGETRVRVARHA